MKRSVVLAALAAAVALAEGAGAFSRRALDEHIPGARGAYEGTFKTGKRKPGDKAAKPYFSWGFNGKVIGTAWVDDIVIEEVPEAGK